MTSGKLPQCLLILGCGYVGKKLAQACLAQGVKVKATVRHAAAQAELEAWGVDALCQDNPAALAQDWLQPCDAVLDSIPLHYDEQRHASAGQAQWISGLLAKLPQLAWLGYLSATSVYADSQGQWVHEDGLTSDSERGQARLAAEQAWLAAYDGAEVFRLAGIYGNERNILAKLQQGNYYSVNWQPAHHANRIHVDDIVATLWAAMQAPSPQRVVNVCDDAPCPHAEYASILAQHIQAPQPIILSEKEAKAKLSATYLSFFRDNKRISNQKLHQELLPTLQYPSFKDAMTSLHIGHAAP